MKIEQGHIQSFFGSGTNEKLEAFKKNGSSLLARRIGVEVPVNPKFSKVV